MLMSQSITLALKIKGDDPCKSSLVQQGLVAQWLKKKKNKPPASAGIRFRFLDREDPLEKERATHSSILA